jgi:hypothetical protein
MALLSEILPPVPVSLISETYTDLPRIAAPNSIVTGRGTVTDFTADGLPKHGARRIIVASLIRMPAEVVTPDKPVFKAVNDFDDMLRFIGNWITQTGANGSYVSTTSGAANGEAVEITFYGTELNLLTVTGNGNERSVAVTIDGVASGTLIWDLSTNSGIMNSRGYATYSMVNVARDLSLGIHTIRLTQNNGTNLHVYGFEVVTNATSYMPATTTYGTKKLQVSAGSFTYNSGFESGTLAGRGGHVLVYQKSDGSIGRALTPTRASAAYLTSTDHGTEETRREYYLGEFLSISFGGPTESQTTILDDNSTSVQGRFLARANPGNNVHCFTINTSGSIFITFVGVGLDIIRADTANAAVDSCQVYIDRTLVGTLSSTGSTLSRIEKIASGLPYGTHTVEIRLNVAATANRPGFVGFRVYTPATPSLPAGAQALARYFILANFVSNNLHQAFSVSTGVIRKTYHREAFYNGTFTQVNYNYGNSGSFYFGATANDSYGEITFYGSGFEFRSYADDSDVNFAFTVDGFALNAGPNGASSKAIFSSAGLAFSAAGVVTGTGDQGTWMVRVTNLPQGFHKLRVTRQVGSAVSMLFDCVDVITPFHSYEALGPMRHQSVSHVASSIGDLRTLPAAYRTLKPVSQAVGALNGPSYSGTALAPLPDLTTVIKTSGNPIEIAYHCVVTNNNVGAVTALILCVNGVFYSFTESDVMVSTAGYRQTASCRVVIPVPAGENLIEVFWNATAGTATAPSVYRTLNAREL